MSQQSAFVCVILSETSIALFCLCSGWICIHTCAKCFSDHPQRRFKQSDYNPFTVFWVHFYFNVAELCLITIWSLKMHLNGKCTEGLRGGNSTLDYKVKMITVASIVNKSHIIPKQANRLREALRRFGLFVRLKDLFLCLSHATQIVVFSPLVVMFFSARARVQWAI